ncbi:radical SAM/SPASM domain-containing protein [Paramaledivibacter caminithermalis]|jgi:uncharacterized protein|uniref:Radical SAM core domain-containing protein n=1 Tax=Paramaledivibacter caminithermalis (strain DSM 15212 / CIP 107654 / DViRD3) TaxID=1121301 RepID=A0A1M6KJC7_PARC5|nr:radical SAM protein [Paramaledivibacter caminithermalis]SHJ58940.1 uncharacterized protein SAMN02745912_00425 [Paramaledivibacter caminithermalis DSM 15212]
MRQLKANGHLYVNDKAKKVMLYDKYNGKLFDIPYDIYEQHKIDSQDEFYIQLNKYLSDNPIESLGSSDTLQHLRFIMTNDCNLRCTYCYANEGSYNKKIGKLSKKAAKQAIDNFYDHYNHIKQISFFGGEPLLNYDTVDYICRYVTNLFDKHKIKSMPMFSMVTNCTLINDRVLETFKNYNLKIVASLDGPKEINDLQRIKKNGTGSFGIIDRNLKLCQEITDVDIECTYTKNHVNLGLTCEELDNFFMSNYGIERVNIIKVIDNGNITSNLKLDEKSEDEFLNSYSLEKIKGKFYKDTYDDVFVRMILAFNSDSYTKTFCDAGFKQFTVNFDGNIYPCQGFVDNDEYILGNITESIDTIKNSSKNLLKKYFKSEHEKCKVCGNKRFCQYCISFSGESYNDEEHCKYVNELCNSFINGILNMQVEDNDEYRKTLKKIYSKLNKQYEKIS